MAIDILHKILGIQTGAFDGHTLFSVRKLFFSPGNDRVPPGKITYFSKENRFSPAPPDRSVGRRRIDNGQLTIDNCSIPFGMMEMNWLADQPNTQKTFRFKNFNLSPQGIPSLSIVHCQLSTQQITSSRSRAKDVMGVPGAITP